MQRDDLKYMQKALELAEKGIGKTSPNPMVGAVIVKNGKIVGEGYHKKVGQAHAEVMALRKAKNKAKNATLYVTLEPCCFYGKTPPCTEAIIKSGVKKVVCAVKDPNPKVNGKGIKELRSEGIKVQVGVLQKEALRLNEIYFKNMTLNLPYVILKMAQTLDGKIATLNYNSKWITSEKSRWLVHSLRSQVDAVLTGINTAVLDDPYLTIRDVSGKSPVRIILDSQGQLPTDSNLVRTAPQVKTVLATSQNSTLKDFSAFEIEVWNLPEEKKGFLDLTALLKKAYQTGIGSILVEGGQKVFTSFLKQKLVDKIYCFVAPKILGEGLSVFGDLGIMRISEAFSLKTTEFQKIDSDWLLVGYPE